MTDVGARVGAVLSGDQHQVRFLGWGVYEGMKLRPDWEQLLIALLPAQRELDAATAARTVADWTGWHRGEAQWRGQHLSDAELEDRARASHAAAQERMSWTEQQVIEDLKNSRVMQNPCIRLDSGKIVWGMECWWGAADRVQARLDAWQAAGAEIVEVDIDDARSR